MADATGSVMRQSSLFDAFLRHTHLRPDSVALIASRQGEGSPEKFTWQHLNRLAFKVASQLRCQFASVASPNYVLYDADNSVFDVIVALACMASGAVEVPFTPKLTSESAEKICRQPGSLRLRRPQLNEWMEEREESANADSWPSIDLDSISLILFTTGTSAMPRGVMLSHRALHLNAAAKLRAVPQSSNDTRLTVLPLAHAYARTCDVGTWLLSGCTLALTSGMAGLRQFAPNCQPTLMNVVPSLAYQLLEEPSELLGLNQLRLLGCGGAPLSCQAFDRWHARGVTVIQGYGLTETGPVIASATPENASAGLVGNFVEGWQHEIRSGQLFVRGPSLMTGYWNNDVATSQRIDGDGWLATGDQVEQDPTTGQLRILGRVDDVIVLDSGYKIHPSLIEREVERIEGIEHAMLIKRRQLELWIDASGKDQQAKMSAVTTIQEQHAPLKNCSVHLFDPPLSADAGELTSKQTIRRAQIQINRNL